MRSSLIEFSQNQTSVQYITSYIVSYFSCCAQMFHTICLIFKDKPCLKTVPLTIKYLYDLRMKYGINTSNTDRTHYIYICE